MSHHILYPYNRKRQSSARKEKYMKKRIIIADADVGFRNELTAALRGSEAFEVVGVATDGEEAL